MEKGKLFKQCVGIDISKQSFTACVCKYYISDLADYSSVEEFSNSKTGFNQFVKWSRKFLCKEIAGIYLMEATGVYNEALAYHLHKLHLQVAVVLPNKARHHMLGEGVKTKTDKVDARNLSQMGAFKPIRLWTPPPLIYRQLRSLTRFRIELTKQQTVLKNHLEALENSQESAPSVVKSYKKMLKDTGKAMESNDREIQGLVKADKILYERICKLETIKGLGFHTIVTILGETQGFELITSRKQLASYAGLDVVHRESGSSVMGKTKISKKGNSHIRGVLYFPAMVAARYNKHLQQDYQRIAERNLKHKRIAIIAIERKLLLLIYTLWKSGEVFKE
jgi:Transposase and inactivated derivatives